MGIRPRLDANYSLYDQGNRIKMTGLLLPVARAVFQLPVLFSG